MSETKPEKTDSNQMPQETLDRIRALAKEATPGPWEYNEAFVLVRLPDETELKDMAKPRQDTNIINMNRAFGPDACKANAEYIAAMHPGMATALVDEIERLRAENARLEQEADWLADAAADGHCPSDNLHFLPDCDDSSNFYNCVKCWREAARKATEAEER